MDWLQFMLKNEQGSSLDVNKYKLDLDTLK